MKTLLQYNIDLRLVDPPVVANWRYLDTLTVQVQFLPDNTLPTGAEISIPLKGQSEYSSDTAIALIENFSLNAQTGFWETDVTLDSDALEALFEPNPATVTLYSNLLVLDGTEHWFQGPTQEFIIQNQYGRGGET